MTAINVTLAIGINDGWLKKFAMKGAVKNSTAYNQSISKSDVKADLPR